MLHLSLKGQKRALYFVKRLQERFTDFDKLDLVKFAWWLFDFRHTVKFGTPESRGPIQMSNIRNTY